MKSKLLTGLFRATRKSLMTTDNDMGMFRDKLMDLVAQKDNLSDEEINTRVEELKQITQDLPDDEGKGKLVRFLEDFNAVKEQDPEVAKKAAEAVADQFEKLDTAAMKDVPGAVETEESTLVEGSAPEAEPTEEVEETVEETTAEDGLGAEGLESQKEEPEPVPTEDDDPNPEYSLEEIYQFIKKRMAEDAEAEADNEVETEEVAEEDVGSEDGLGDLNRLINSAEEGPAGYSAEANETKDECKEDEVVTDHAPHIPVTMNRNAAGGNLGALFNLAKGGR